MTMLSIMVDMVSWVLIVVGSLSILIGGVGVLRFPDVYTRMHAASITDTVGAGALLLGLMVQAGFTLVTVKLLLMLIFLFLTSPTSSFSLAHAALSSEVEPLLDSDRRDGDEANVKTEEKMS